MIPDETAALSRVELRQKSVTLFLLVAGAIFLFLCVSALTRTVHRHQLALASEAARHGQDALHVGHYDQALEEFHTALLHDRDNEGYDLGLAEALLAAGHSDEAEAYLLHLRDRQPENGEVNLALARIAAQRNRFDDAEKYYHCAIYAAWQSDRADQRRAARRELIDYLLRIGALPQAQAELMALAANADNAAATQLVLGALFLRVSDAPHALADYRAALRADHHNEVARSGMAQAQQLLDAQRAAQQNEENAHD